MRIHYTIPSNNWELQLTINGDNIIDDYTIPSNNWELQPIYFRVHFIPIIPYQVITGNYSLAHSRSDS